MKRFVEGTDRGQNTLFPECLQDWICEDNPVRVIDIFVDELDLAELRFSGIDPEVAGVGGLSATYQPSSGTYVYNHDMRMSREETPLLRYWVLRLNVGF